MTHVTDTKGGPMVTAPAISRTTFLQRIVGASMLDVATYEEVEADPGATRQAIAVVLLSSASAGVGVGGFSVGALPAIAIYTVMALMGWAAWCVVIYQVGVHLLPDTDTRADVGELLRTVGFATAPGVLRLAGVVPGLATPMLAITAVWMLAAMIVAVRQALDYRATSRAILVCVVGWVFALAFVFLFGVLFAPRLS